MRCLLSPVLVAIAIVVAALPTHSQAPESQNDPTPHLTERTTLVVVPALVRDKAGKLVFAPLRPTIFYSRMMAFPKSFSWSRTQRSSPWRSWS